jgi:TetR/AcrR family transcriptional regulator, tetracycline repressor protein
MAAPSRRNRPRASKRPIRTLTRDKIVKAGLSLVDREGADSITMRGVAVVLGVTPMALYNHVSSKKDLLRAIAEHVLGEAAFDGQHDDWREQIRSCFRTLRNICLSHPGMARLLETADVPPAAVFAPMDVTLRALAKIGLDATDSLRAYFTLVSFTLSQASYQTRGPFPDLEPSEKIRVERLTGRGYAAVERLDIDDQWDFDAAFEFGITLIIAGLESRRADRTRA